MSRDEAKLLLTKEANGTNNNNSSLSEETSHQTSAEKQQQKDEFILCIYEYWKAKRLKYVIFEREMIENLNKILRNFCYKK
jgi:hypothetical protein